MELALTTLFLLAVCSVGVASSAVRRRGATAENGALADAEDKPLVETNGTNGKHTNGTEGAKGTADKKVAAADKLGSVTTLVAILVAVVLVTTLVSFVALRWESPREEGPFSCKVAPTTDQRLAAASIMTMKRFGNFSHPIHTRATGAQRLFNWGLIQVWSYNVDEARRTFATALDFDKSCVMCMWGIAQTIGPGANRDLTPTRELYPTFSAADDLPEARKWALDALDKAQRILDKPLAKARNPDMAKKELAYAKASVARFAVGTEGKAERDAAEVAFAEAMTAIGRAEGDMDALAFAAQSYLNLYQWSYYKEDGTLKPEAVLADGLIDEVLAAVPDHPLALHLKIHITEASSTAKDAPLSVSRGEAAADAMATTSGPWSQSNHLLHMPAHTFVRSGRWHDAVQASINAYWMHVSDARRCMASLAPEHDVAMLIYAAAMGGEYKVAEKYALKMRKLQDQFPLAAYGDPTREWASLPLLQVMYGQWDRILNEMGEPPANARGLCPCLTNAYAVAVKHFARSMALAARASALKGKGAAKTEEAMEAMDAEIKLLEGAVVEIQPEPKTVPGEGVGIYTCDYVGLGRIYLLQAQAKALLVRGGDLGLAEGMLREAITVEEAAGYVEPPRLLQPVRHALGYLLLKAGKPREALQVYEEQLRSVHADGFALMGLAKAHFALADYDTARKAAERYGELWRHADSHLDTSSPAFAEDAFPVHSLWSWGMALEPERKKKAGRRLI